MIQYTKQDMVEIRGLLQDFIAEMDRNMPLNSTAQHIYDCLFNDLDPQHLERELTSSSIFFSTPSQNSFEVDYRVAHDVLFGDPEILPLHLNDALLPIAKWRLERGI